MAHPHILLFGDQLVEKHPSVKQLYSISKSRPQLRRFLQEATDVVHHQLESLVPEERQRFGVFTDLLELAEHYQTQPHPDETIGAVLLTTVQLGEFLS